MSGDAGTSEAGDASSSTRAGAAAHATAASAGSLVRLPEDHVAVESWLTRDLAQDNGGPLYATEDVLALWPERRGETAGWTFGLELEFGAADAEWVAIELHALGLTASPVPSEYHGARLEGFWTVEQDRSVSTVFLGLNGDASIVVGGEVVSPPLRDVPETWRQVQAVLDVLRRCGAEVNQQCGFHVHVGVDALRAPDGGRPGQRAAPAGDGSDALRAAHEPDRDVLTPLSRLAILAGVCFEDLVFRLASAEGGRHRGRAVYYRHCRPLERPLAPAYGSVAELAEAMGKQGAARRAALNLTNVGDPQKDTVEFRHCNGTLDGRVIQAFCRLCFALVGAARWQPDAVRADPQPLGTHWRAAADASEGHGAFLPATDPNPAPLWRFIATVFPQGLPLSAAASLLWLYGRGAWQPCVASLAV